MLTGVVPGVFAVSATTTGWVPMIGTPTALDARLAMVTDSLLTGLTGDQSLKILRHVSKSLAPSTSPGLAALTEDEHADRGPCIAPIIFKQH